MEQLGAVDVERLGKRIRQLDADEMWAVDEALQLPPRQFNAQYGGSTVIDERTRHEMYLGLEEKLGTLVADAMMQHLPPVGWADVATKHDLAGLEERMELRFHVADTRFEALLEVLDARFDGVDLGFNALEARMTGAIEAAQRRMIQWTVGTMIALTTVFTAVGAITQLH